MKRVFLIAALLLGAAAPAAAPAQERPGGGHGPQDSAREAVTAGRQAPLSRVIATIAQRYPGRQMNTTQGDHGGRPAYFVQWQLAKNNQLVVFIVDAQSGQIIGQQGG